MKGPPNFDDLPKTDVKNGWKGGQGSTKTCKGCRHSMVNDLLKKYRSISDTNFFCLLFDSPRNAPVNEKCYQAE